MSQENYSQVPLFQFHKGSIKTLQKLDAIERLTTFQFHKGSIKTQKTMSREVERIGFQFHKGSIKTVPFVGTDSHTRVSIP